MYLNTSDFHMRIGDSYVRHDGEFCYISGEYDRDESGIDTVSIKKRSGYQRVRIDSNFDVSYPKIGNLNSNGGYIYMRRHPLRKQKQGFKYSYCNRHYVGSPSNPEFKDIMDMLENKYPTLEEALKNKTACALSRNFGISNESFGYNFRDIYWKDSIIGFMNESKKSILLFVNLPEISKRSLRSIFGEYNVNERYSR